MRGFRCLDEGDLLAFWESKEVTDNWLLEIESGGWMDQEAKAGGFLSKMLGYREFLIKGMDDCISVISGEEPIIRKHA